MGGTSDPQATARILGLGLVEHKFFTPLRMHRLRQMSYCREKIRQTRQGHILVLDTRSSLLYNDTIITTIMEITAMINQSLTMTKNVKSSQLQPSYSLWLSSLIVLLLPAHNQLEKLHFWIHRDSKAIKYQNTRGFQT